MTRLLAILCIFAFPAFAKEYPRYSWEVLRVIDGDTVTGFVDDKQIVSHTFPQGLPDGKRIGKMIMVGGYTDNLGYKEMDSFFQTPIEWDNIRQHCIDFVAIHSDNDQYVPLKHADIFKEKLGAKVIIEHNKRHMGPEDKLMELPSALEAVKG